VLKNSLLKMMLIDIIKTFMLMRMLKLESKMLHDNGFKVIPMLDLRFDQITNYMYKFVENT
jgi:hypothetical protein